MMETIPLLNTDPSANKERKTLFCLLTIVVLIVFTMPPPSSAANADFSEIIMRLEADGVPSATIDAYFGDERFELLPTLLKINVKQPDARNAYEGFVQRESVNLTSKYLNKHISTFESVLDGKPVDKYVVAAILRVESSLGNYKGNYRLMNVFATLSLLDSDQRDQLAPSFWHHVFNGASDADKPALREKAESRSRKKASWAYRELKTLLMMAANDRMDPLDVKGSWAGAFGLPQFLPSSMEMYGRDGNGDGIVDLDNLEDSIASIAHYLKRHGYTQSSRDKRQKAIKRYNHSDDYVDCIMTLAHRVAQSDN